MKKNQKTKVMLVAALSVLALLTIAVFLHGCGSANGTIPGQTTFFGAGS